MSTAAIIVPGPRKSKMHPALSYGLKLAIGATAIFLLLRSGAFEPHLLGEMLSTRPGHFLGALAIYLGLIALAGLRWYLLLRSTGIVVAFSKVFQLHMIGLFFTAFLPGGTGGDLVKGVYLFRENERGRKGLALSSMVVDRVVGVYALLTLGCIMTMLNWHLVAGSATMKAAAVFYLALFAAATSAVALFLSPLAASLVIRLEERSFPGKTAVLSMGRALVGYRDHRLLLLVTLLMTLVVHMGIIMIFYIGALGLGVSLSLGTAGFLGPVITMVNGLPLSPGGLGVSEAAGEVLFRQAGVPQGGSEILALYHLCVLVTSLLGVPFYLLYRRRFPVDAEVKAAPIP